MHIPKITSLSKTIPFLTVAFFAAALGSSERTFASTPIKSPVKNAIVSGAPKAVARALAPKIAPAFTLTDTNGKTRTLAEFRGRPVTLFFFCGCPWCHKAARLWSQFQRGGALTAIAPAPATVVVFSGDAEMAKQFAAETNLDLAQTILLPDERMHITTNLYHADPCPRVFVIDTVGHIRYINNHKDDAPREAAETAIVSRALGALRAAAVQK